LSRVHGGRGRGAVAPAWRPSHGGFRQGLGEGREVMVEGYGIRIWWRDIVEGYSGGRIW
jgi:hypothetical protein